jgi:hypothetical protein
LDEVRERSHSLKFVDGTFPDQWTWSIERERESVCVCVCVCGM